MCQWPLVVVSKFVTATNLHATAYQTYKDEMLAQLDLERAKEQAHKKAEKERDEIRRRVEDLQGKSRLAEKEAIIAARKANEPLTKVLRLGGALTKTVIDEVTDVAEDVVVALTPNWVLQQRQHRHYL
jgi:lipid II:glycine glycyltransferase (peptidoglycan interpeptide bridge formation enzyme)